jgi:hypothetical protein
MLPLRVSAPAQDLFLPSAHLVPGAQCPAILPWVQPYTFPGPSAFAAEIPFLRSLKTFPDPPPVRNHTLYLNCPPGV